MKLMMSMLYKSGSHSHKAAQDQKPSHLALFPTAKLAREMRTASTHKQRPLCLKKIKLAFRLDLPFLVSNQVARLGWQHTAAAAHLFCWTLPSRKKWIERMRLSQIKTNYYACAQTLSNLSNCFLNLFFEDPEKIRAWQRIARTYSSNHHQTNKKHLETWCDTWKLIWQPSL